MGNAGKTILVMGATGRQGGATARRLLADGWSVRAFTRAPSDEAAQRLAREGARLCAGDMNDRDALDAAMEGTYGVFSVQPPEWDPSDAATDKEIQLGRNVADAAMQAGVRHFVYSSVGGADRQARFRYSAKWEIEKHIREIGLRATVLRPAGFMESYANPLFGLNDGILAEATKPDVPVKLIAVDDVASFAALAFERPEEFVGRTIELAGDAPTPLEMAASISKALRRPVRYANVPIAAIRSRNETLADLYEWLNGDSYEVNFNELRRLHPALMTFDAWLGAKGAALLEAALRPEQG
ncbi:NmrA/HSCARG family protein [Cohnella zeiphila]|uniref:NmrA/HSCARG family protein n=1 Tax=Cohnella zeiphila TaxID=2761120 RepID=A0A7X0VU72_9BACL|nr:NmrA/HSCARG family protein [Cohnella zeiphila]MBB6729967.1 NmrA/HSCARG family protein [Cohnella zeiphila]